MKLKEVFSEQTQKVNKRQYDLKTINLVLPTGDTVLIRNVAIIGNNKLEDKKKSKQYIIVAESSLTFQCLRRSEKEATTRKYELFTGTFPSLYEY